MQEYRAGRGQVGTAYFAIGQTHGKGQREKAWVSNDGENIMLSLILQPRNINIQNTFNLSCAIALACSDFFSIYAGEETKIKWPNDIFWRDRKAGGILIESAVSGTKINAMIVGIGINVNQISFPAFPYKAVSLRQITGKEFDPIELSRQLCLCIQTRMEELEQGKIEKQLELYNTRLFGENEEHVFRSQNIERKAKIIGVSQLGELIINDGTETSYRLGEIEWVL